MRTLLAAAVLLSGCLMAVEDLPPEPLPSSACQASHVPAPATCVRGGLAQLEGPWTASGRHRSLHGQSLGGVTFELRFDQVQPDRCIDVAGQRPDPISANWPDPNGTWYVTDTAATLRHTADDELAVFWDVCVDARSGMLFAFARSGFTTTGAGITWVEDFSGTLVR